MAPMNNRGGHSFDEAIPLICTIASPIPVLMFGTILFFRSGYPTYSSQLASLAGISLLLVNVIGFGSAKSWKACGAALAVLALAGMVALGLVLRGDGPRVGQVLALIGLGAFLWNLIRVVTKSGFLRAGALLALGMFVGIYSESMYWREYN